MINKVKVLQSWKEGYISAIHKEDTRDYYRGIIVNNCVQQTMEKYFLTNDMKIWEMNRLCFGQEN